MDAKLTSTKTLTVTPMPFSSIPIVVGPAHHPEVITLRSPNGQELHLKVRD